jgi:hypothetical protein
MPLLARPPIVTTTFPVVAPGGTGAFIDVFVQFVGADVTPLKLTLALWPVPKLLPLIVTVVPTAPEVGDRLVIDGALTTVKLIPLLNTPF